MSCLLRQSKHGLWFALVACALVVSPAVVQGAVLTGKITDAAGKPVAGVAVYATDKGRGNERFAETDASGQYRIQEFPAGDCFLRTCHFGWQTHLAELSGVAAEETRSHDVTITPAKTYTLENDKLRFVIDENGTPVALVNKLVDAKRNYIAKLTQGFWRLIYRRGQSWENEVLPQCQRHEVQQPSDDTLRFVVRGVRSRNEVVPLQLVFTTRLKDDELVWNATIDNAPDIEVTEFFFPEVGSISGLADRGRRDELIWPEGAGAKVPFGYARRMTYPSRATMSWCELTNGREGIYFASYDDTFLSSEMQAGPDQFGWVKFPFIRPNERWESKPFVLSPHVGTWHVGADKYRAWMNTWRKVRPKPKWVENTTGMYLVILNQQYGDVMWRYDELPYLYQQAKAWGVDTVGLFGWTEGGHDNKYPVYDPGDQLGGQAELRKGLKAVADAGGHTICYLQGRLLDAAGDYFRSAEGQKVAARNLWGTPYFEQYNKSSHSALLRRYSLKLQGIANPSHPEWHETLSAWARRVGAHGPSGMLFDQIGGMEAYPAFDSPGVNPSLAFPQGQQRLLARIRQEVKSDDPERGFVVEWLTDVYSQYVDLIHGCGPGFAPGGSAYPAIARYVLPDVILTQRNPRPWLDPADANFALAYGFRYELEVRYRDDAFKVRNGLCNSSRDYVRKVSELRKRYWDLLGTGRYIDTVGVQSSNPAVRVTGFEHGNRRAVVTWNNTSKEQTVAVTVPGYRLVERRGVDGAVPNDESRLGQDRVCVWIFEK
jgi:hypothetical protein